MKISEFEQIKEDIDKLLNDFIEKVQSKYGLAQKEAKFHVKIAINEVL